MIVILIVMGLMIGSFLNVVICRVPLDQSIINPPSHCPKCNQRIKWYMNIPLLSYIFLRGRCGYCKSPISWQYPLIEFITAVIITGSYLVYGISFEAVSAAVFVIILLIISIIDIRHFIIPWEILIPGMLWQIYFVVKQGHWLQATAAFFVAGIVILTILVIGKYFYKKDAMGGGDVYYAAFIAFFLGLHLLPLFFIMSFISGSIIGVIVSRFVKKNIREMIIPFGPFLSVSGLVCYFWGDNIWDWYLITVRGAL